MGSSIRNNRDVRGYSGRTYREPREDTKGGPLQKTLDHSYTAHGRNKPVDGSYLNNEPSSTDQLVDHAHEFLRDTAAPRIQTMSFNAALVDRREFLFFKRKQTGRRCSCYGIETSPQKSCSICYGTGIVGGYEKHGCWTEILDFTTPQVTMVNIEPNFEDDTRPVYLKLMDGADFGYIEADFQIRTNIGKIDTFIIAQPIFNRKTKVFVINPTTMAKVPLLKNEDLEPFLTLPNLRIRVEMEKGDERPLISHFMFRYRHDVCPVIWGDIPNSEESLTVGDFGRFENYSEISIFFNGKTVRKYDNEDFLYRLTDGRRFVITRVAPKIVAGVLTSVDVTARFLIEGIDDELQTFPT